LARLAPGLAALTQYDRHWLFKDLLSGLSVAAIAAAVLPTMAISRGTERPPFPIPWRD
jgi:MFS superfamily sulfate permease-like transporter